MSEDERASAMIRDEGVYWPRQEVDSHRVEVGIRADRLTVTPLSLRRPRPVGIMVEVVDWGGPESQ